MLKVKRSERAAAQQVAVEATQDMLKIAITALTQCCYEAQDHDHERGCTNVEKIVRKAIAEIEAKRS